MEGILKSHNRNKGNIMLALTPSRKEKIIKSSPETIIFLGSFLSSMLVGFFAIFNYLGPTLG